MYLDQKQLATSAAIMQRVNPALFDSQNSPEKLLDNEEFLENECKKMNDIKFSQHFLPTTLRAQRFKDWTNKKLI